MNEHPTMVELESLVRASLGAEEREVLMDHLGNCDQCFEAYERFWAQVSHELPEFAGLIVDRASSERAEARLFGRIRAARFASESSRFLTEGYLQAVVGILLPIIDFGRSPARSKGGGRQ